MTSAADRHQGGTPRAVTEENRTLRRIEALLELILAELQKQTEQGK